MRIEVYSFRFELPEKQKFNDSHCKVELSLNFLNALKSVYYLRRLKKKAKISPKIRIPVDIPTCIQEDRVPDAA